MPLPILMPIPVRLLATITALAMLTAGPASAAWTYLPEKDALSTPAKDQNGQETADLVIVCNNMVRLTYVRWHSEFGIEKKRLPNHLTLDYTLTGAAPGQHEGTLWTIARPENGLTQFITHDLRVAERLTSNDVFQITTPAKDGLPALSASFNLEGLQTAMDQHNLPCSEADKFLLKTLKEKEADAAAAENRARAAKKTKKAKKSFAPMPDASMFDP